MSAALANFLFEAVNFLLLAAALGYFVWKPARRALDAERERYAKREKETQDARAQAETLRAQALAAQANLARELDEERKRTLDAARAEAERVVAEARAAQAGERQRFEQELASMRAAQAAALAELVGRIAAESVRRLLESLQGPVLDLALVRAARSELAKLANGVRDAALVESARPLDDDARPLLQAVLPAGFQERVVPELGAGVRVTTRAGQVDATALSIARRAAHELAQSPTAGVDANHG